MRYLAVGDVCHAWKRSRETKNCPSVDRSPRHYALTRCQDVNDLNMTGANSVDTESARAASCSERTWSLTHLILGLFGKLPAAVCCPHMCMFPKAALHIGGLFSNELL